MKPLIKLLIAGVAFSAFHSDATDLRIDNVKLYQANKGSFTDTRSIYIDNGKIVAITNEKDSKRHADNVLNAQGKYAVSGLTDLHVHLGSSGSNFTEFQYLPVESHFNANLYLGVTGVVDLFSFKQTIDEADVLKKQKVTPNLFYAGTLFTNPGGHGTQYGGKAYVINKDEDIPALWQEHLATKPHVTKAVIESFGGYTNTLTDSQLAKLGALSKQAGLPFFVHVSTLDDGKRAVKAGATALAHGINSEAIDKEFVELMVKHNVTYIPTLAVYHNHASEKEYQTLSQQQTLLPVYHEKLTGCLFDKVPSPSRWMQTAWDNRGHAYQNLRKLHKAGVAIGTGSDAGNPYTLHGFGLHNEIDALAKAGLSNTTIINASTINAAKLLGVEQNQGQLKEGYIANIVIVDNNPVEEISALHQVSHVIKDGALINRDALVTANKNITPQGQACNQVIVAQHTEKQIDDFTHQDKWSALSDSIMGGQSSAQVSLENKALMVNTRLGKPTNFGAWAGTELKFAQAHDASSYQGIEITYKGSTVPFSLSVYHSDVKDWDHFSKALPASEQWQTVKINFNDLKQFGFGAPVTWSAKNITGLNFMWRKMPGMPNGSSDNQFTLRSIAYF